MLTTVAFSPIQSSAWSSHDYTQNLTALSQELEGQVPVSPSYLQRSANDNYGAFD